MSVGRSAGPLPAGSPARRCRADLLFVALATLLAFVALLLSAQEARAGVRDDFEAPRTDNWLRLGSFYVQPAVTIKNIGIDSNVYLTPVNPSRAYTATLGATGRGAIRFGSRAFVTLNAMGEYVWFSTPSPAPVQPAGSGSLAELSHPNYGAGVKGNLNLRKLRLFAAEDYARYQERPTVEVNERPNIRHHIERGGVGYESSSRSAIDTIVTRETIDYSASSYTYYTSCLLDGTVYRSGPYGIDDYFSRTETTGTLRFSQMITGRTRLILDGSLRSYDFATGLQPNNPCGGIPVVGAGRNAKETRVTTGVEILPGGTLVGSARIGLSDFRPEYIASQKTREPVGAIMLNWRLGSRISLLTAYDRDLYFSFVADNIYFMQDHAALQGVYYFNRLVGVEAGYDRYWLDYPTEEIVQQGNSPVTLVKRQADVKILGAGVRLRLADKTSVALRVSRRQRSSNIPGSLADNQVLFSTSVETTF